MTFAEIVEKLRDGKRYTFSHPYLDGTFHKAPFPSNAEDTYVDGAASAITFWKDGKRHSPTLMLYDFDDDTIWMLNEHPTSYGHGRAYGVGGA